MKIGRLKFPAIRKDRFDYDQHDFVADDSPDCTLSFKIKNDIAYIETDWNEDFPLESLVTLLVPIATGQIVESIFIHMSQTRDIDEVKGLQAELIAKLKEIQSEQNEEDEPPLISPIDTFNHLASSDVLSNSDGE